MQALFVETEIALFDAPLKDNPSIPLKSLPRSKPIDIEPERLKSRHLATSREATALLILSKAHGFSAMRAGDRIPRSFALADRGWVLEKGCGQDIVRSGIAGWIPGLVPLEDAFVVSRDFTAWLASNTSAGLLSAFYARRFPSTLEPVPQRS